MSNQKTHIWLLKTNLLVIHLYLLPEDQLLAVLHLKKERQVGLYIRKFHLIARSKDLATHYFKVQKLRWRIANIYMEQKPRGEINSTPIWNNSWSAPWKIGTNPEYKPRRKYGYYSFKPRLPKKYLYWVLKTNLLVIPLQHLSKNHPIVRLHLETRK
jgi:hypothetical protein